MFISLDDTTYKQALKRAEKRKEMSIYDLEATLDNLEEYITYAKNEFDNVQERTEELETENAEQRCEIDNLTDEIQQKNEVIENLKRDNENLKLNIKKAQDELKKLKEFKELMSKLDLFFLPNHK